MELNAGILYIDEDGCFKLPKQIRQSLNIKTADKFEIFLEDDAVIYKKYEMKCLLCGDNDDVTYYNNKCICYNCLKAIKALDGFE